MQIGAREVVQEVLHSATVMTWFKSLAPQMVLDHHQVSLMDTDSEIDPEHN